MPSLKIPKKLKPLLKPKKFKIIYGGRGSGKSMTVGDLLLMRVQTEGLRLGCMREMMNSIDDSVHALLKDEISRLELHGFEVQNNAIYHTNGGEVKYKGLARNPESVKSMHGFKVFWVEEAATLSKNSLDLLIPTLRADGSELWLTFNPQSSADPVYQEFIKPFEKELLRDGYYEDDLHIIIKANYSDNPFFPENLDMLRRKHKDTKTKAEYNHIWLGHTNDEVEGSIIPVEWFDAAIDAHEKIKALKPKGARIVSHDPSDIGEDAKALCFRHGSIILDVQDKADGDVNDGCDWAMEYALRNNADEFVWDADGLGVSLKRQVAAYFDGTKINYSMFKGSHSPDDAEQPYQPLGVEVDPEKSKSNRHTFKNKRAQYYWKLRDRFYATYRAVEKGEYIDPDEMISLSSSIECMDALRAEECRIPKKPNNNGLIQIMSKDEMSRKHDIPSPNMADSLMMSLITPNVLEFESIDFASEW